MGEDITNAKQGEMVAEHLLAKAYLLNWLILSEERMDNISNQVDGIVGGK